MGWGSIKMKWVQPMEPIAVSSLIKEENWIHQIKWDGIRGLSFVDHGSVRIYTKKQRERTDFYPEIYELPNLLQGKQAILDGEIVVLDENSNPSFQRSLIRERVGVPERVNYYKNKYPVAYIIFDILFLDGQNLTSLSLLDRREILERKIRKSQSITITDDFINGNSLYQLVKNKNWEGIVSKKLDSQYISGKKHMAWLKLKFKKKLLAIVCGIKWKDLLPNTLVLGVYRDNEITFIGKASLGLSQRDLYNLKEYGSELINGKCPFKGVNDLGRDNITWLQPLLTCWISFLEWTAEGLLRHSQIIGFSSEKAEMANGKEWLVHD